MHLRQLFPLVSTSSAPQNYAYRITKQDMYNTLRSILAMEWFWFEGCRHTVLDTYKNLDKVMEYVQSESPEEVYTTAACLSIFMDWDPVYKCLVEGMGETQWGYMKDFLAEYMEEPVENETTETSQDHQQLRQDISDMQTCVSTLTIATLFVFVMCFFATFCNVPVPNTSDPDAFMRTLWFMNDSRFF